MSFNDNQFNNPYNSPGDMSGKPPRAPLQRGSVKNYMVESILCLIFCFWPCAIPAIISASKVDSKLASGDYHGAVEASQNAKKWCLISMCVGLICVPTLVGLQILAAMAEHM